MEHNYDATNDQLLGGEVQHVAEEQSATHQGSAFFGSLHALQEQDQTHLQRGHDAAGCTTDAQLGGHGTDRVPEIGHVRDWLATFTLIRYEDYVIDPQVEIVRLGLGWETRADIDSSAVLFDSQFEVVDVVWFKSLRSKCGSVSHSGDNTTGEGSEDDEVISVDLASVPLHVHHVLFTVSVYSYNINFSDVRRAYVRMMHGRPEHQQKVMCTFSLTELSGNAILMGQMTRKGGYWSFRALGTPAVGRTVQDLLKRPENLVVLRESRSFAPSFREVSVRVVRGSNLAAKDAPGLFRRQATSDPYHIISFKNRNYASQYKKSTLDPEWNEEPFCLGPVMEAEPAVLRITVFDYDIISADDFMGAVEIPARSLFNAGFGEHSWTFRLMPSKLEQFKNEEVSGDIHITFTVKEIEHAASS